MSDILSKEENNTASAEEIKNAGNLMTMVTGNVLAGAVMSHTTNATAVSIYLMLLKLGHCIMQLQGFDWLSSHGV